MQGQKGRPHDSARSLMLRGGASALALVTAGLFAGAALAQDGVLPQGASTDGAAAATASQGTPPNPAQLTQPTPEPRADAPGSEGGQEIVVTGSRIARKDYSANSPIVTANEALLKQSSTSAIEQNLNKLPQFTPAGARTPTAGGGDIQPTPTNTPGTSAVSLRGIGANRNLVLIDGRRATPSNALGIVDINTIPSVAIERVEIISGGASSTYGADAVGGVVNFILKKNFSGFQFDAQDSISQRGDGNEYTISGIMGANFPDNRGNITFAMSTNERQASLQVDRPWFQKILRDPQITGNQFFPVYGGFQVDGGNLPSVAAINANIPGGTFTAAPIGQTIFSSLDGSRAFTGFSTATLAGVSGFGTPDGLSVKRLANGALSPNRLSNQLVLPLTRYNAYARGTYEIADNISVFGQALFSKTNTFTVQEPSPIVTGWAVTVDPTINRAVIPKPLLNILDSRANPNAPFQLTGYLPQDRTTNTDVYNYNLVAGVQGKVPSIGWTYEIFGSQGESEVTAIQNGVASLQRLQAVIAGAPNFGAGFSRTGNQGPPNFGFGAATATCTSGINLFTRQFSADCQQAIGASLKTKSVARQTVWEGDFQGPLFALPAGTVRAAIGADYRSNDYEFQNDNLTTQGESFIEQAVGIYPSGNSRGRITVHEFYGELLVPVLSNLPFVKEFDLELGGRMSDFSTTGKSYTYKALGDWQVTDWLRFRGGYNRAERAPNIAELFLAASQTFAASPGGDTCSTRNGLAYSANPDVNPNYRQALNLCGQLMERSGNPDADLQYYGVDYRTLTAAGTTPAQLRQLITLPQAQAGGFAFPTLTGNPNLQPEVAKTITAGVVVSSPFKDNTFLNRLRLSVDYYQIKVSNAIGQQSPDIVQRQCYDPAFNPTFDPTNQFCLNSPRNATGALGNVVETFVNNGRFRTSGIDAQIDWAIPIGPGSFSINSVFNYLIDFKAAELPTDPLRDFSNSQGPTIVGLDGSAYRYKVFTTFGYTIGGFYLGMQWRHLPSIRSNTKVIVPTATVTGVPKSYDLFNLQGNVAVTRDIAFRYGVNNLFDKAPPLQGRDPGAILPNLQGGSYDVNNYDVIGRSFYLGVNFKF